MSGVFIIKSKQAELHFTPRTKGRHTDRGKPGPRADTQTGPRAGPRTKGRQG